MGGWWQLVALVVGELRVFSACGGDARAPVYSEEQSRDICEDPRLCLGGDSQQTKREQGEQNNKRLPWVPEGPPTEQSAQQACLNKTLVSGRQHNAADENPTECAMKHNILNHGVRKCTVVGQFGMPVTHVHSLFVL